MILNVSGRTDIVAFYTEWFMHRYHEGFVDVRNPFNPKLVSRIYFDDVDLIVFCTKNPRPIIKYLNQIKKPILFHTTLTPYKEDIEPNVKNKSEVIKAIKEVSQIIGKENLLIRYDPIFLSDKYNLEYHKKAFEKMCSLLSGYTDRIIVSFIDDYKNVRNNAKILNLRPFTESDYAEIGKSFSTSAQKYNMVVQTCFEEKNLIEYGFVKGECLSLDQAFKMTGKKFTSWKARNCQCANMVDIGVYNSCPHFCKYCYANYDEIKVNTNFKNHDPNSSLLVGKIEPDDIIKERHK
jgi:hypothetical protein